MAASGGFFDRKTLAALAGRLVVILFLWAAARPANATAETLYDAIRLAYNTNPVMRTVSAELRQAKEGYVQARASYGPQAGITAEATDEIAEVNLPPVLFGPKTPNRFHATTGGVDLSVVQPIYTSGATLARVRAAGDSINLAGESLRQTEATLLLSVVTAYADVERDRAATQIIRDELGFLVKEFDEIQTRGAAGQLSNTDVFLAKSRLISARAQLDQATARIKVSNAEYESVVGQRPGDLAPSPDLAGLPTSLDEAVDAATHFNPQLRAARDGELSAREGVNEAKAAFGPTVSIRLDGAVAPYQTYLSGQYQRTASAAVVISMPIFTSGANSSKVRAAQDGDIKAETIIETTQRNVVRSINQAWEQLNADRALEKSIAEQIAAEELATTGYRIEQAAGLRSTVDLLNAELETAGIRIAYVQAHHDVHVDEATLLAAMGQLEMHIQDPGASPGDTRDYNNRVRAIGTPPWVEVIQAIDSIAAPHTPAPVAQVSEPQSVGP